MLKKILGTIGTRYLIAFLNLMLIFINAKALGVEGVGMVGILLASVNIAVVFNGVLSGNTIVYFMNRYSMHAILLPAYAWPLPGSGIACGLMSLFGLFPNEYFADIYILSLLSSYITNNARFLLGKDKITGFNLTYMMQGGLLFFILLYFYYVANRQEVASYIYGLYITYGIAFAGSLLLLLPDLVRKEGKAVNKPFITILKEMFVYGLWGSADNTAEVLTTRLNYFLIQRFAGLSSVGLLDAGTKISESVWHISRSVSFIEYGSVAKTTDPVEQRNTTLKLFKLTFCAIAFVTVCILFIPEWVYTEYLFSPEFTGMRKVIFGLATGIVALGCNSILSSFFIGSGKIRYSAASSGVGLVTLLIAGYLLIPLYGVVGSAISTSIAFCAMLAFSLTVFCRLTGISLRAFIPDKDDLRIILKRIQKGI
ncbi:lipopolysaccharide biosynthesis protein [Parabacteroides sp.]